MTSRSSTPLKTFPQCRKSDGLAPNPETTATTLWACTRVSPAVCSPRTRIPMRKSCCLCCRILFLVSSDASAVCGGKDSHVVRPAGSTDSGARTSISSGQLPPLHPIRHRHAHPLSILTFTQPVLRRVIRETHPVVSYSLLQRTHQACAARLTNFKPASKETWHFTPSVPRRTPDAIVAPYNIRDD
jgi:hypothetical protein